MHKKKSSNKPLSARMSAVDEQKGPNVRGFRALSAPRGQIRRDVRGRTKIPRGVRSRRTTGALEHIFDYCNKYTIVPLIVVEFGITSTLLSVPFPE